jgi:hypothetical protein
MIPHSLIPAADPNPLPAPFWVFKLLLVATFALHILAMNSMLGGAVLAVAAKGRARKDKYAGRLFFDIARKLPSLLPATITLGVAPLLFVQVLYGEYFYSASIILAWPWFGVLLLLTAAYYGFYFVSLRGEARPGRAGTVLTLSAVMIAAIGFIYTSNLTLTETPTAWGARYFANPGGWNLNLSEATLAPRYLHFFTAAIAVGGLLLMFMGFRKSKAGDPVYARYVFRFGARAFAYATMAQFVIGFWFLVSLPRELLLLFMGGDPLATVLLLVGVAAAVVAILAVTQALHAGNMPLGVFAGTGSAVVAILAMAVMRDLLRDAYLKPYFSPSHFVVQTQWSVLPLFLAVFAAGVVLWVVMIKRYPFAGSGGAQSR